MLIFTQRLVPTTESVESLTLALDAEERTQSRLRVQVEGRAIALQLPRGTVLLHNDWLGSPDHTEILRIVAKPEPVLIVTAATPLKLLRAAYHLGNRHVPLEITPTHLKLAPDPVLQLMLRQLDVEVAEAIQAFQPESGAYGTPSAHAHAHHPDHAHS